MAKVLLSNKTGAPYLEISVGYGLFAKYRVVFVNREGSTLWTKTGHSADGVVEKMMIGVPMEYLGGGTLSWKIVVAAFDEGEQPFYSELKITQDNTAVPNGTFVYKGRIALTKNVSDGSGLEIHD